MNSEDIKKLMLEQEDGRGGKTYYNRVHFKDRPREFVPQYQKCTWCGKSVEMPATIHEECVEAKIKCRGENKDDDSAIHNRTMEADPANRFHNRRHMDHNTA